MKLVDLATKLVSFQTVSQESSTKPIADFISNYLEMQGFHITRFAYETTHETRGSTPKKLRKVNLIARKGDPNQKCRLALSGHMDTVPFRQDNWKTNPLQLTENNGRYYGMGIADMKLFDAIAIKAGEMINTSELKHPFCLYFTSDEEVGCVGAKRLVNEMQEQGEDVADYVIIGEPTEMHPKRLHKGYMYFTVTISRWRDEHQISFEEKSAHSSEPNKATNVVEKVLPKVINAMSVFKSHLENVEDKRFIPPYPTMNIGGAIQMNEVAAKNVIPGYIRLENEMRIVPGQDAFELKELLQKVIRDGVKDISPIGDEKIRVDIDWVRAPTPPMETPDDSVIVRETEKISHNKSGAVSYNTEGGVFNASGSQSVIWGPASIAQAHKDNEFANCRWFEPDIVNRYVEIIRRICC